MTEEAEAFDIEGAVRFVKSLIYQREFTGQNMLITVLASEEGLTIIKTQREDYYRTGRLENIEMLSDASLKIKLDYVG